MPLNPKALRQLRDMGVTPEQLNAAGITPDMEAAEVLQRLNAAKVQLPSAAAMPTTGAKQSLGQSMLDVKPAVIGPSVRDIGETVSNIPGSAMRLAGDIAQTVASPVQTAKTMGKAALGAPGAVVKAVTGGVLSENEEIATTIGKAFLSRIANPGQTVKEDPVGAALDVAGVAPIAKVAGATRAANAARAINPVRSAGRGLMAPTKAAGTVVGVAEDVVGFTTGKGRRVFEESFEAGKAGGAGQEALRAGRRGKVVSEEVADAAIEGFKKLKAKRDTDFREALPNLHLKTPSDPVNVTDIKRGLPEILERFGIRVEGKESLDTMTSVGNTSGAGSADLSGIVKLDFKRYPSLSKGEHAQIQRIVSQIMKSSTNTPLEAYTLLRQARSANSKAKLLGNTTASKALSDIEDLLRTELGKKVAGFDEMMKKFSQETTMLEQMQKSLSIQGQTNETLMTKLVNMLNDRENLDLRRRLVEELEEATGEPIKAQIAGIRTADPFSGGLGGSVIRGAGLLGVGSGVLPIGTIALLPFTSPRIMGRFFETLGATTTKAKAAQEYVQKLTARIPKDMVTDGLTVGAIVNQLEEEEKKGANLFPDRMAR